MRFREVVFLSDLMEFIKSQWADIHHSRNQEWTVLGMIGISLYFLSQSKSLHFQIAAIGIGIATCAVGILISIKHWAIFYSKIRMINICQEKLGIEVKLFESPLVVQGMIIILYFLIISILSALLTWLLFDKAWISVTIGIIIIIHGIVVYFYSGTWARKKQEEVDVKLSSKFLLAQK